MEKFSDDFFTGLWAKWLIKSKAQKAALLLAVVCMIWAIIAGIPAGLSNPLGGMTPQVRFWTWVLPQLILLGGLFLWAVSTVAVLRAHRCRR